VKEKVMIGTGTANPPDFHYRGRGVSERFLGGLGGFQNCQRNQADRRKVGRVHGDENTADGDDRSEKRYEQFVKSKGKGKSFRAGYTRCLSDQKWTRGVDWQSHGK